MKESIKLLNSAKLVFNLSPIAINQLTFSVCFEKLFLVIVIVVVFSKEDFLDEVSVANLWIPISVKNC